MSTETRTTLSAFIERTGARLTAKRVSERPDGLMDGHRHFRCTLSLPGEKSGTRKRRSMIVYFSQGNAWTTDPTVVHVLNSLALDAAGFENGQDFADWCGEYGYDTDSRQAFATYAAVQRLSIRLKSLLGDADYQALLWHTEKD